MSTLDKLTRYCTNYAENSVPLINDLEYLTIKVQKHLIDEHNKQNRYIEEEAKYKYRSEAKKSLTTTDVTTETHRGSKEVKCLPFEKITQIRLIGVEEPTNFDLVTYKTELALGIEQSMKKFPDHMTYPSGFVAVVYYYTYLCCILIDQYNLYLSKKISADQFWATTWLFFDDPNRKTEELETIEKKKKEILFECEKRSRELHNIK
jgi:hypothetical protein